MVTAPAILESIVGIAKGEPTYDLDNVKTLIRQALIQTGLGKSDPQRPLADIVEPGMTVLLKPNWVATTNKNQSGGTECLYTQPQILLGVIEELRLARPGGIILGAAPLQRTPFDEFLTEELMRTIEAADCELVDFRSVAMRDGRQQSKLRPAEQQVMFDLEENSQLEPVTSDHSDFRVTVYDPAKLSENHRPGRHRYMVCREVLEADLVLNLPKLKTHCKVGLTCCLKNLVGIVSDKGYLPHHRRGGSLIGGDCYEGYRAVAERAEWLLDDANRALGTDQYRELARIAGESMPQTQLEGAWPGNDTCWRMVRDLNHIVRYGDVHGQLSATPQRQIWSVTDAIIAGGGNGPLAPSPIPLGVITCSNDSLIADRVHARLLHLDPERIPLLRESDNFPRSIEVRHRNEPLIASAIAKLGQSAKPPPNWESVATLVPQQKNQPINEVWIHPDQGPGHNWFERMAFAVADAGLTPRLFNDVAEVPNRTEVATFQHLRHSPAHRQSDKRIASSLAQKTNLRQIPNPEEARLYDDKLAQTQLFKDLLPPTYVCDNSLQAEAALAKLPCPFVSKSSDGAGSANVRLIETTAQARDEIRSVFRGDGIETHFGHAQQGYLLWQEFCPGNENDWRVLVIGRRYAAVLIRNNRPDVPFASGSGLLKPVRQLDEQTIEFMDFARDITDRFQFDFCGLDLIRRTNGEVVLLETTTSWSMRCYEHCQWFAYSQGEWFPTGKLGYDMFELIVKWLMSDESVIQLA